MLDREAFRFLSEHLSAEVLNKLRPEWEATKTWRDTLPTHQCSQECQAERKAAEARTAARVTRQEAREDRDRRREQRIQNGEFPTPEEERVRRQNEEEAERDEVEEKDDRAPSARCPPPAPKGPPGCELACRLPIGFGLSCRHWLFACAAAEVSIPLSLIHLRWLLDPSEHRGEWTMTWTTDEVDQAEWRQRRELGSDRHHMDIYRR